MICPPGPVQRQIMCPQYVVAPRVLGALQVHGQVARARCGAARH